MKKTIKITTVNLISTLAISICSINLYNAVLTNKPLSILLQIVVYVVLFANSNSYFKNICSKEPISFKRYSESIIRNCRNLGEISRLLHILQCICFKYDVVSNSFEFDKFIKADSDDAFIVEEIIKRIDCYLTKEKTGEK